MGDTSDSGGSRGDELWLRGLKALGGAVVANLVLYTGGTALLDIPSEFPPLAAPFPAVFFTLIGTAGAVATFAVIRRVSKRPEHVFTWIAAAVLVLSFLPDIWLLSDGAAEAFPGGTVPGVVLLMLMHVAAAAVIVRFLTGSARG